MKITQQELNGLFGEAIPLEVISLLMDETKSTTEIRRILEGMATVTRMTPEQARIERAARAIWARTDNLYEFDVAPDHQKQRYRVMAREALAAAEEPQDALADLVSRFSDALLAKLRAAEVKYGYDDAWMRPTWRETLNEHIREHVEKGDPRDVAAYCAFAWHHGWSLKRD